MFGTVNGNFELYEIYKMCGTQLPSFVKLTSLAEISETDFKYIWKNRQKLNKCFIRMGYFNWYPYLTFSKKKTKEERKLANDYSIDSFPHCRQS